MLERYLYLHEKYFLPAMWVFIPLGLVPIFIPIAGKWLALDNDVVEALSEPFYYFGMLGIVYLYTHAVLMGLLEVILNKKSTQFRSMAWVALYFAAGHMLLLQFVSYPFDWFSNDVEDNFERNLTIGLIVLDTMAKGGLLDLMESYDLNLSTFQPVEGEFVFDTFVFVFRTLWSLWFGTLILVLWRRVGLQRQGVS